jgi:hypothetical protein
MVDMQGVDSDVLAADVNVCRTEATNVRVMRIKAESDDIADVIVLGVGMVVPFGFVGMALISGISAGLGGEQKPKPADDTLQQKTLVNCMARKGYRNVDPNVTVAQFVRPNPASDSQALRTGRDTYMAESYAKSKVCEGNAKAALVSKGPGYERHSVACSDGRRIALRCEFGICAPEQMEVALGNGT